MRYDWLPEDAADLEPEVNVRCSCRYDYVPDPDPSNIETDLSWRPLGKWYPRTTFRLVEYNPKCRYGDHAAKAQTA
jgi:hypothetical protein